MSEIGEIFEKAIQKAVQVEEIFKKLQSTQSMTEIADIVDSLDENMAKLVLKKFVYARD